MGEYITELGDGKLTPYVEQTPDGTSYYGWGEMPKRQVVRCRDCVKWSEGRFTGACSGQNGRADPDGFCAWGEPRRGGADVPTDPVRRAKGTGGVGQ